MQLEGASKHSNHPDQVLDALEMSLGDPAGQTVKICQEELFIAL
jgi:hypothetical protein